jgi:long-chain acyl-CoA synthetase
VNSTKVLQLQDSYIFSTSGTSGGARRVERDRAEILREINYLATEWPARRIVSVVPIRHIYGYLWTVLLGQFLHVEVVNVRGWSCEAFAESLREGDLVVGYPGAWRRWADVRWRPGVWGVSSGGGVEVGLGQILRESGLKRWTEIYGCTELGAVGLREDRDTEYKLLPYWPERLAGIEAPDYLEWRGDRSFLLGGRRDGLVKVNGMAVEIGHVREVLLGCPGVWDVALRMGRARLTAMVAGSVNEEAVRGWVAGQLESWERPELKMVGARIPLDELGKPLFDLEAGVDV